MSRYDWFDGFDFEILLLHDDYTTLMHSAVYLQIEGNVIPLNLYEYVVIYHKRKKIVQWKANTILYQAYWVAPIPMTLKFD